MYLMLKKKRNVRQIHRLQIIGLLEANFNTALKIYFARKMMTNSARTDLTEKQWGGRPGKTGVDPAMRKMLAFKYSRLIYVTIVFFANDVVACFNRMVSNMSTLVAHKYGVASLILQARNLVTKNTEHRIKTHHGVSKSTYKQEPIDVTLAGEMQGKADPACLWSLESQILLSTNNTLYEDISLPNDIVKSKITKNNDAFVDDCN